MTSIIPLVTADDNVQLPLLKFDCFKSYERHVTYWTIDVIQAKALGACVNRKARCVYRKGVAKALGKHLHRIRKAWPDLHQDLPAINDELQTFLGIQDCVAAVIIEDKEFGE